MSDQDTALLSPQIRAMNEARVRALAEKAATNDDKLRRAVNVVRAAIRLELLDPHDLMEDKQPAA